MCLTPSPINLAGGPNWATTADLGWADDNSTVPLSDESHSDITHKGLRATASSYFVLGVTERVALSPVLNAALHCDIRPDAGRLGHFGDCLTATGLQFAEVEGW
ncbi:hypothetical protein MCELHM10_01354 [Paracoccaceae bacterium]